MRKRWLPVLALLVGVAALAEGPRVAEEGAPRVVGTIFDTEGKPVAETRVVVKTAGRCDVFVSPPSDAEGNYAVPVPAGDTYVVVALIQPTGSRVPLPEDDEMTVGGDDVTRHLKLEGVVHTDPRRLERNAGVTDRLFTNFIEDPALVRRQYWEAQVESRDLGRTDELTVRVVAAFQPEVLPQVEVGARLGYGLVDVGFADEAGFVDAELWGKLLVSRSATQRSDVALGAVLTLPTGDTTLGLGSDALQSKLFVSATYALSSAILVGHVGMRATGDGELGTVQLDGTVSPSAGAGIVVPFSPQVSFIAEAGYDGKRFEGFDSESEVLVGLNWKTRTPGMFRAAVGSGLNSDLDVEVFVGYAFQY